MKKKTTNARSQSRARSPRHAIEVPPASKKRRDLGENSLRLSPIDQWEEDYRPTLGNLISDALAAGELHAVPIVDGILQRIADDLEVLCAAARPCSACGCEEDRIDLGEPGERLGLEDHVTFLARRVRAAAGIVEFMKKEWAAETWPASLDSTEIAAVADMLGESVEAAGADAKWIREAAVERLAEIAKHARTEGDAIQRVHSPDASSRASRADKTAS